jgi:hypothetical protein
MPNRAEVYRRRADECMAQAAAAKEPEQKKQFQDMAEGWRKLAHHAEQWQKRAKGDDG